MVVIGRLLYSGKSGFIVPKWLYLSKLVVFGQSDCIRAKVVLFWQKRLYSGKVIVFG